MGETVTHEFRFVLPAFAIESQRRTFGAGSLFPQLLSWDPPLPEWVAVTSGGCWRLHVVSCPPVDGGPGKVHRAEYYCRCLFLPLEVKVSVDVFFADGDCSEANALQLEPDRLLGRLVTRESDGLVMGDCTTVYCLIDIRTSLSGILRPLQTVVYFATCVEAPARRVALRFLKEHWRGIAQRWPRADNTGDMDVPSPTSSSFLLGNDTVGPEMSFTGSMPTNVLDSPNSTPREKEPEVQFSSPHVAPKGTCVHNGFLYKLGDGLLNQTWNLRYFLLSGSTLQYFKSPHEARARDVIDLSGAVVQRSSDQTRPFAFEVLPKDRRPLYMSGNTEREASEWVEWIQRASKLLAEEPAHSVSAREVRRATMASEPQVSREDSEAEAAFKACAEALSQAGSNTEYGLLHVSNGLRFCENKGCNFDADSGWPHIVAALLATFPLCACVLHFFCAPLPGVQLLRLLLLVVVAVTVRRMGMGQHHARPPLICSTTFVQCSVEDVREVLTDSTAISGWHPWYLDGRVLSLPPMKDEVLYQRVGLGVPGMSVQLCVQRRWLRGNDGMWLLCAVAERGRGVGGFEGIAVAPCDSGTGCAVLWLCGLELMPSAPRWLQRRLAVRYTSALAGLREWVACSALRGGHGAGAGLRDTSPPPASARSMATLAGLRRGISGGIVAQDDLERAALAAQLLPRVGGQLLAGHKHLSIFSAPPGPLTASVPDMASRYGSRWAYAPLFLPHAGGTDGSRDRLMLVVTFAVAGLHLAAASFPHLPWVVWRPGARHSTVLPGDAHVQVDVSPKEDTLPLQMRSSKFEVVGQVGSGYRICGCDHVTCHADLSGHLRFVDTGITSVECSPGEECIKYTMPDLRIRPSSCLLGRGSVYDWTGSAHFVDVARKVQCDLRFGCSSGREGSDVVSGTLRNALGAELGRIHGSWLGPLFCDTEVLWRGPRLQPAPY